jgi:hypothetical protein
MGEPIIVSRSQTLTPPARRLQGGGRGGGRGKDHHRHGDKYKGGSMFLSYYDHKVADFHLLNAALKSRETGAR